MPTGLQFALQPVPEGFLVTDGHHNRVLLATLAGEVTELVATDNTVPTGLAVAGHSVYVSETGPVPHPPEDGKVVSFDLVGEPVVSQVASGYSLVVDIEFGSRGVLYALSQGDSPGDVAPASPAVPDSGRLLRVTDDGSFSVIVDGWICPPRSISSATPPSSSR